MIPDPIFCRFFETSPEPFLLLGVYKLPRPIREEIPTLLQIYDIRESHGHQKAKEAGREEGIREGMEKGVVIVKPASQQTSAAEIASALNLDEALVRKVIAESQQNSSD